jgi:hypothetical protein
MKAYVPTASISVDDYTPVTATYEDAVSVPSDAHPGTACFVFPSGKHLTLYNTRPSLDPSWRDDLDYVINAEAGRRISEVFADYQQRNATQYTQQCLMQYGSDTATWPVDDQATYVEAKRGWDYVAAVRTAAANLQTTNPINPCDDSHWPAPIAPIHFE